MMVKFSYHKSSLPSSWTVLQIISFKYINMYETLSTLQLAISYGC